MSDTQDDWAELERLLFAGLAALRDNDLATLKEITAKEAVVLRRALGGEFDDVIIWDDE